MSYENAPATKMLASFCAYCSRPLLRPDSVEAGIGPECRKRHNVAVPVGPADWTAAYGALAGALEELPEGWEQDARKVVNALVHRVACQQHGVGVAACVNAIQALGYVTLAARIAKRVAKIRIVAEGDVLKVKTPFDEAAVEIMRAAPGRYVGKGTREVPNNPDAKRALHAVLRRAYPNAFADGPRGVFLLAA